MNNLMISRLFGRMDNDYQIVEHNARIANQNTLSGEVYDQILKMCTFPLPITRANFIRMWKTLILKRIQDIYECEKKQRPDNFVRLVRTIMMPAPLADLLFSIGSFTSTHTGKEHQIVPPPRPAQPEPFWNTDQAVLDNWNQFINRTQRYYQMKEYPSQREVDSRPLILTYVNTNAAGLTQVKAVTNEPKLQDAFIRAMNDDLLTPHNDYNFQSCALVMTPPLRMSTIRGKYIAG